MKIPARRAASTLTRSARSPVPAEPAQIDDFIITLFNSGSTVTFPLQIFGASRVAIPPQINVLATAILLVSVALLLAGNLFGNRRGRSIVSP